MATIIRSTSSALAEDHLKLKVPGKIYMHLASKIAHDSQITLQESLEKAEHALTMERIRLHLAHTHASGDCERRTRDVLFYEAKVEAGGQRYEPHKVRAEKDLEATIYFHERRINMYWRRKTAYAFQEVKRIRQSLVKLEKHLEDLELEA